MTPFCWVGGGGDQENSTSLSPATAPNISGALGAVFGIHYYIIIINIKVRLFLLLLRHIFHLLHLN